MVSCSRAEPQSSESPPAFSAWKWHEAPEEGYRVFAPSLKTSSSLNVPTPEGDLKVPVTYFRTGNDIFYVSSQPRRLPGPDAVLLDGQARGIEGKFKVGTITREPFTRRGCAGLRLYVKRPDSFKIVELIATPSRMYQVVTDLASETASRRESLAFRLTFFTMEKCR